MVQEIMDKIIQRHKEHGEKVDASFQAYRQAGLGLSATIITLDLILMKVAADKISLPLSFSAKGALFCMASLLISILFAVGIQFFNYIALKLLADRHFFPEGSDNQLWFRDKTGASNRHFSRSTESLYISMAALILGLSFVIYFWAIAK